MTGYNLELGHDQLYHKEKFCLSLNVENERITNAKSQFGYNHRGFEKMMEYRNWMQNLSIVSRVCTNSFSHEMAYVKGVEELLDLKVPERANYLRTIVLEIGRIMNHQSYLERFANATGISGLSSWIDYDIDYFTDLLDELTGRRFYYSYIVPGGVKYDCSEEWINKLKTVISYIEKRLEYYNNFLFKSRVFLKRTQNIGKVTKEEAVMWNMSGPNLRASAVDRDVRKDLPYASYEKIDFEIPCYPNLERFDCGEGGDVYTRTVVRFLEIEKSIEIIENCVKNLPQGEHISKSLPSLSDWKIPEGIAFSKVESGRGELSYLLVSDGSDKPRRVHIIPPSLLNGTLVLENVLKDAELEDVPLIFQSLDISPLEVDR